MASITLQPCDADTYIDDEYETTNYGTSTSLISGSYPTGSQHKRILLKFNNLSNGTIPKNSIITSATLSLYLISNRAGYDRVVYVNRLLKNWVENEATWQVYSSGNSWEVAGAHGSTDYSPGGTGIGSINVYTSDANVWKNISLNTDTITKMIRGEYPNYGFRVSVNVDAGWWDEYSFASREYATSSYRPKLTIEYQLSGGFFYFI